MKLQDYIAIAGKNIRRQRVRTLLTVVAMAISATILITLTAISIGMREAVVSALNPDSSLTTITATANPVVGKKLFGGAQEVAANDQKLDDKAVEQLGKLPHVQAVAPATSIWEFRSFAIEGKDKQFVAQAQGIAVNDATKKPLAAGEFFQPGDTRNVAIIGYTYAKELGFGDKPEELLGKQVRITTQHGYIGAGSVLPKVGASEQELKQFSQTPAVLQATIIGVTERGADETSLLVPLDWARKVRTHHIREGEAIRTQDQLQKDGYTHVYVKVDSAQHVEQITEEITGLGFGATSTLAQLNRMMQVSSIVWVGLGAISLIALIAASLGVVNTMLMSVTEQRFAIGVWRACGATRGVIARLFLLEACMLGLFGGVLGAITSFMVAQFVNQQLDIVLKAQNLATVTIAATPWWLLIGSIGLTIIFGAVSGLYPAYRAARQDPSEILASN